jgi:predicted ribosome quality control (RQC) complex YloA/Tae2 family protein
VGVVGATGRGRLRDTLGREVSSAQAHWRANLEGSRIVGVQERQVTVVREGLRWAARVDGPAGGLCLADEMPAEGSGGIAQGRAGDADDGDGGREPVDEARRDTGARIVEALSSAGTDGRRAEWKRVIAKAAGKLKRRIEAIRGDLTRVEEAEARAERARPFVVAAAKAPPGTKRLEGVDWSSGEARAVTLDVDPARAPRSQLETIFSRARRLREGSAIASSRLDEAVRAFAELTTLTALLASDGDVDLAEIEARARSVAPRELGLPSVSSVSDRKKARGPGERPPYRLFHGASGARILVGRGAAHNDALTFHVARPHDLWLHAKGHPGAHIVVPLDKGGSCPADVLVEAAHLAAHFSGAREENPIEITYASRRYLRKPRGSAPGLVVVDREKVLLLRRDPQVLARLLQGERDA